MRRPGSGSGSSDAPGKGDSPAPVTGRLPARWPLILGGLTAFAPLSIDMYLPSLPSVTRDLDAPASAVQLTLTACLVGLAIGQLFAGPLSDVLGRRRPLLVGLVGYTVTSLLCAAAPSVWALVGLRLIQGGCGATGIVIARAVVRDLRSGTAAARLFALLMLVTGVAPILAPTIGAGLLHVMSWRGVFLTLALIGAVLLVATTLWVIESLPPSRRRAGGWKDTAQSFGELVRDRAYLGYALASGLAFAAMFSYISGSPFVLQDIYGLSPQLYGLAFGANAIGIVIASQTSGLLVHRIGARPLLRVGLGGVCTGSVAVVAVVLLGFGLAGLLPALFVAVGSVGMVLPNATALALADRPRGAGSASALLGTAQFLVGGLAAPLVGLAGQRTALPMGLVMAACGLAAAVAFTALTRTASVPRS